MKAGLAVGALAALAIGGVALATSRHTSSSISEPYGNAGPVLAAAAASPAPAVLTPEATAAGAVEPVVYRERVVYRQATPVRRRHVYVHKRSGKKSAVIIGGSTVGGAVLGGLIGGKKGAIIGGLVGGGAGTVYDRKTRKRRRVVYR
jgi:uncharacterized protein YcfJ